MLLDYAGGSGQPTDAALPLRQNVSSIEPKVVLDTEITSDARTFDPPQFPRRCTQGPSPRRPRSPRPRRYPSTITVLSARASARLTALPNIIGVGLPTKGSTRPAALVTVSPLGLAWEGAHRCNWDSDGSALRRRIRTTCTRNYRSALRTGRLAKLPGTFRTATSFPAHRLLDRVACHFVALGSTVISSVAVVFVRGLLSRCGRSRTVTLDRIRTSTPTLSTSPSCGPGIPGGAVVPRRGGSWWLCRRLRERHPVRDFVECVRCLHDQHARVGAERTRLVPDASDLPAG